MSKPAWFAVLLLLLALPAAATVQETRGMRGGKPYLETTNQRTVTATVVAVDKTTRVVKLRTEAGDTVAVVAGPEVKNLAKIKLADVVNANITEQVTIEVAAGAAAKDTNAVSATSARPEETPHGTRTQQTRSTATIVAIDTTAGTATLKGQDGNAFTVKAKHKETLDKVKVGDLVVFTVRKSVAVSVENAGAKYGRRRGRRLTAGNRMP